MKKCKRAKQTSWKIKLASIGISSLLLLTGLMGCAPNSQTIYQKAVEKTQAAKSYRAAVDMDMGIGSQGIHMDIGMKMDMQTLTEPVRMKGEMSLSAMGFNLDMKMYLDEENSYINMMDQWYRSANDNDSEENNLLTTMNQQDMMGIYTAEPTSIEMLGEEEINGQACYKLEAKMSGEEILKQVNDYIKEAVADDDTPHIEQPDDITMILWINKKTGYFDKVESDMTQALAQWIGSELEKEKIDISKFILTISMSDYNAIEEFVIPQEVLDAPEMPAGAGSMPF